MALAPLFLLAFAAAPRLAIIADVVEGAKTEAAELTDVAVFERVARIATFAPGIELVPRTELAALDEELRRCGSEVACIASRLRFANVELAITVVVNLAVDPPLVATRFLDCASSAVIDQKIGELGTFAIVIEEQLTALFEVSGRPLGARLVIDPIPAGALITVNTGVLDRDAFLIGLPKDVPKTHVRVVATADGFLPRTVDVEVSRGVETHVAIALVREPAVFESTWFWIGAAAVVVAGASAAAIIAASYEPPIQFKIGAP